MCFVDSDTRASCEGSRHFRAEKSAHLHAQHGLPGLAWYDLVLMYTARDINFEGNCGAAREKLVRAL